MQNHKLTHASKSNPCPHCGKTDWCYSIGELSVCKRDADPALGWERTSKRDKEGSYYYAPSQKKEIRPKATKDYFYPARDRSPLVKVARIDDGTGKKSFPQSHWNNGQWEKGNPDHIKRQIPIYRYQEVRQAIAAGQQIFIVEGESVADVLWGMGLAATTFIGGAGKYRSYGTGYKEDLAGASVVLCPDRDKPGIAHMDEIAKDFPDAQWLYAPPNPFFWDNLPESQGLDVADWVRDGATSADILNQVGAKKDTSNNDDLSTKSIVYVDNSSSSTLLSTPQVDDGTTIQAIVGIVYTIIDSNFPEFLERHKLNTVFNKYKDNGVDRKLFESIVASARVKTREVLPEDEIRLKSLMDYSQTKINWDEVLPAPLARAIKHDADTLNIDPVLLWQALLPAVSSLAGTFTLDEYGGVPAINWTYSVVESGGGKTRADSLIFAPLRKKQMDADADYKEKLKQYKRAIARYEKAGDFESPEPEHPALRKYTFEVATIQSVLRRLAEQGKHGSLWARDEVSGLFKSLNQFSSGETEGTQLLLKLWDGKPTFVDRVDHENSFAIPHSALSLTGGIQPGVFRKVFSDETDADGMQARGLFAVSEARKKKYTPGGYCQFKDILPGLYDWLDNQTGGTVELSSDAQKYFAAIVNDIGNQIEQTSHPGIRTWMNKLDTHILRIALALHLIECYFTRSSTDIKTLSQSTLKRAVTFAQYYRSAFHVLQEKVSVSDDIASIMLQIHTAALNKHPDGISARDIYKDSRPIQNRAKSAGREVGAYVADLFEKMQKMGYGEVVRKGRSVRFIAAKNIILEKEGGGVDNADNVDNSPESLPDKSPDCLHPCRQNPIVYVDNQNNTQIRIDGECQKELSTRETVTAKESAFKPAFNVGDRVTIANNPHDPRFGKEGVVTGVVSDEDYLVTWEDGQSLLYELRELEPIRNS